MKFEDLNFKLYKYDPSDPKVIDELIESNEEFKEDLGEHLNKQRDKVVKYMILMYDMNSELREEYHDLYHRKAMSAQMSGFKILSSTKKFNSEVTDMLIGKNDAVNGMITKFLFLCNNPDHVQLSAIEDMYFRQIKASLSAGGIADPNKFKQIEQNIQILNERYKQKTSDVFGGKESVDLEKKLYEYMSKEKLRLVPEAAIEALSDGVDFLGINIYGDE